MDAQRLGSATKYTASEATNLQIELAKLGFSRKEILQSTEGILKFAQATGSDLPEAAALAGAALRMFGAETSETERYVSAMAVATTKAHYPSLIYKPPCLLSVRLPRLLIFK